MMDVIFDPRALEDIAKMAEEYGEDPETLLAKIRAIFEGKSKEELEALSESVDLEDLPEEKASIIIERLTTNVSNN